ncbi:major facilitator transporter [Chania multitudinisentens RB-25]|uniref:Major facilitator transporter n=1 Tax=Chania multitudinisentens RB-25 TaxID=1441930 RepID=W0LBX1_9GAMM|nr:MFS transporter [Chania multitudinisentens]AHG19869.2 major facilitator transporter [Chania multitudinisentens RB-25]
MAPRSPQQVRMDDVPLNAFHLKIAGLTFGAHLTDGYVLGVIGFALAQLKPQMALTPFWEGMIGSSALIGLFLGSLVLGWLSDRIGRQKIFSFSFVIITLASVMQFFAATPEQLFWLRVLVGVGLGGDYAVGHTMLAEFSPRKHRGILLGSFSVIWTLGYVAAGFAGHFLAELGPDSWRWLLASSAVPALLIMLLRIGTPESPRWLMRKGRIAEAHQVVRRCFGPQVILNDEIPVESARHLRTLFSARYWRRTAFNSLFFVCLVIPYFAIYTFLPSILTTLGQSQNFATDLLLNALLMVGALLGIMLTQWLPRRRFLIGSFWILAASLGALALVPPGQGAIPLFALFTLTISAVSNLVGVFPAESFPTDIRSLGVGFATSMSRLGSAISTGLLPLSMIYLGLQTTMLILTGVLVLGAWVSILWAPETKDLTLVGASSVKPLNAH